MRDLFDCFLTLNQCFIAPFIADRLLGAPTSRLNAGEKYRSACRSAPIWSAHVVASFSVFSFLLYLKKSGFENFRIFEKKIRYLAKNQV
jgi:hypothetical protein